MSYKPKLQELVLPITLHFEKLFLNPSVSGFRAKVVFLKFKNGEFLNKLRAYIYFFCQKL